MHTRTTAVFGNPQPAQVREKAKKTQKAYIKAYGDDRGTHYALKAEPVAALSLLELNNLKLYTSKETSLPPEGLSPGQKALVVGTIRMGFGHYRIALALASAAKARGYKPYWLDLHSQDRGTGAKIIAKLNSMYSLGSRLSQSIPLFNKLYWEPLNAEGFKRLSYNAQDQAVSELMAPALSALPKGIPYLAAHAWAAQAAVHAGLKAVVNVIPDNWPMALHLAEGATHCVQSPSAWWGYKTLRDMGGKPGSGMPEGSLLYTGHYIDHELVSNLAADTQKRLERLSKGQPLRVLLSVGGAGAQKPLFIALLKELAPLAAAGRLALWLNLGDHRGLWEELKAAVPQLGHARSFSDDWAGVQAYAEEAAQGRVASGTAIFLDRDPFCAVYATNLLMRQSDLLITKPSELAYYPVPKLHISRVGGHEAWGAIRSAELGDGSVEAKNTDEALNLLKLILGEKEPLQLMNQGILAANAAGVYNGAYKAVDTAIALSQGLDSIQNKEQCV